MAYGLGNAPSSLGNAPSSLGNALRGCPASAMGRLEGPSFVYGNALSP